MPAVALTLTCQTPIAFVVVHSFHVSHHEVRHLYGKPALPESPASQLVMMNTVTKAIYPVITLNQSSHNVCLGNRVQDLAFIFNCNTAHLDYALEQHTLWRV